MTNEIQTFGKPLLCGRGGEARSVGSGR